MSQEIEKLTWKDVRKVMIVILIIIGIIISFFNIYTVNTGETAVITRFGKVVRTEQAGLHVKIPLIEKKAKFETREQKFQSKFAVSSEDIQSIETEIAVQYKITDIQTLYKDFKTEYKQRLLEPRVAEIVQANTAKYTIEEVIEKRQQLSTDIFNNLKADLAPYGIQVSKVSIVNHDFSDAFEKAIENKKVAEQTAKQQEIKNAQELRNTENQQKQRILQAESNLKVKRLEAQANNTLTQSLTPSVLKKMYIDKWNGQLPKVQGSNSIVNIPMDDKQ